LKKQGELGRLLEVEEAEEKNFGIRSGVRSL
jgi:hypothetical protein